MSLVSWNPGLSVNIKSIDDQHIKLIEMLNDFYDNITSRPNRENISKLISGMKAYTIEHFTDEERLMKTHGYPAYTGHKKEHDLFISKVSEVEDKFNSGRLVLSLEMTSFLFEWLKKHIQGTDMKYSEFLIERGVK
jgi:hemerythrin